MTCALCGGGVYKAEDQIVMTKVWHKCCFRCCNCKNILDTRSAKFFQGEIFCDRCYGMVLDELETVSSPVFKPCRVVSSPSSICIKEGRSANNKAPTPIFNYCKKYDIHIPPESEKRPTKSIKSCSCISDIHKTIQCGDFPIPREVANYCNRLNMRRKNRPSSPRHFSLEERPFSCPRNGEECPCITIRTISPPKKRHPPRNHRDFLEDKPVMCCCTRHRSPSRPDPCRESTFPARPRRECTCNSTRRHASPPRRKSPTPRQKACCCCCRKGHHSRRHSPAHREYLSDPDISEHQDPEFNEHQNHSVYPEPSNIECPNCCRQISHCPNCPLHQDNSSDMQREYPSETKCPCCPIHGRVQLDRFEAPEKITKYCICGKLNPCGCKMSEVKAECTSICLRCNRKVYAAEKISISSGSFHINCFCCYCCHKLLDVKTVYEHKGEIYCKNCYNSFMGNQYYGHGASQYC